MPQKTYGYVRVSTRCQKEDRQVIAMREFGVPAEAWWHGRVSAVQAGRDFIRQRQAEGIAEARERGLARRAAGQNLTF